VRSIRQKDIATLSTVSGIGKKKAERLVLELQDKFEGMTVQGVATPLGPGEEAVSALTRLGYPQPQAEAAVRGVLGGDGQLDTAQVVRQALQRLVTKR
jgi:Holliday junction DNA helicase RuvA